MRSVRRRSLWELTDPANTATSRFIADSDQRLLIHDVAQWTHFPDVEARFRGRSVLIALRSQLQTALALLELDGVAKRIMVAAPDLMQVDFEAAIIRADVDLILSDGSGPAASIDHVPHVAFPDRCHARIIDPERNEPTEWALFTSGTSGPPKLAVHGIESLTCLPDEQSTRGAIVWSTFYDTRRYGGLHVLLRALKGAGSIVLKTQGEALSTYIARLGASGVTHVSGTPSHWRAVLLSMQRSSLRPENVRLGGEICDQSVLDRLQECFPEARVTHSFASTEAGVVFDVQDGQSGFPASFLRDDFGAVRMKVKNGSLHICSQRAATRYLGDDAPDFMDAERFIDTGDLVELRRGRFHFSGRRDGAINSGGFKVNPETVEAVINGHPDIHSCQVYGRPNPVTGMIIVADLVLKEAVPLSRDRAEAVKHEVSSLCAATFSAHQVPVMLRFVPALATSPAGKLIREPRVRGAHKVITARESSDVVYAKVVGA